MSEHRDEMKRAFSEQTNETLLSQLAEGGDGFTDEARELMEAELLSRGMSRAELESRVDQIEAAEEVWEDETPRDDVVPVATFMSQLFAAQALDLLRQSGIEGIIQERDSLGDRELPTPDIEEGHTLLVDEVDLARAREILDAFAPAAGKEAEIEVSAEDDEAS